MSKKVKKVINIVVDIIVVLILIVSVLMVTLSLTTESSGVPNIFGIAPLSVQSDSMEDTINTGDLIFASVSDISDEYKVNDIVTFPIEINGERQLNTHRIVEVINDENITYYKTQGDNRKKWPDPDEDLQTSATIVAKYTGTKIGGLGNVLSFLRTQLGFFLCVLLPMIFFFIYETVRVVMNIIAYNQEKALEQAQQAVQNSELTEEQKQKAIEEYLASLDDKSENATEAEPAGQTPTDGEEAPSEEQKN